VETHFWNYASVIAFKNCHKGASAKTTHVLPPTITPSDTGFQAVIETYAGRLSFLGKYSRGPRRLALDQRMQAPGIEVRDVEEAIITDAEKE
jgi:hypothetical protein